MPLIPTSQIGGKGTMRRKVKKAPVRKSTPDQELENLLKEHKASSLPEVSEVRFLGSSPMKFNFPSYQIIPKVKVGFVGGTPTTLEEVPDTPSLTSDTTRRQNRYEKRFLSLLKTKVTLRPMEVTEVKLTVKRDTFMVKNPEVFSVVGTDKYAIFGQVSVDNRQIIYTDTTALGAETDLPQDEDTAVPELVELKDTQLPEGVTENDIDMVMGQCQATREQAIATLGKNSGDIVQSIMDLS